MPIKLNVSNITPKDFACDELTSEVIEKAMQMSVDFESDVRFRVSCVDGRYRDYLAKREEGACSVPVTQLHILGGVLQVPAISS